MAETLKITTLGQGTPLVLIHGWGLNSGIWQPTAQALSESFQVISIDLPGFGLNQQRVLSPYSLENVATMVSQAIKAHTDKPAIYLGWSLGGLVATQIALQSPQQVFKLVNVCSTPYFVANENWPGIKPEVLTAFHQQLAADSHKTIDGFLKIQAMGSPYIRQDLKQIKSLIMEYDFPTTTTLDDALKLLETVDLRAELSTLAMPCLNIYGRLDTLVPSKVIPKIKALAPTRETIVFDRSSHAPFISEPELFIKLLSNWLNVK